MARAHRGQLGGIEAAREAFIEALDRRTLADLVPRAQARQIIQLTGKLLRPAKAR